MSPQSAPRPSQVTVAGWTVAVSSAIVLLAVFQAMGDLDSVDMREQLARTLSEGTFSGLGVSVAEAVRLIRGALYVAGVAAVVTGVLGVYVLQRHRVARVVLSVAAVPVVLTAPFAGSLPGMVVGAGALMLWTRPARDWFAGRPVAPARPERPTPPVRPVDDQRQVRELRLPEAPVSEQPPSAPPPTPGWGAPPAPRFDFPAPTTGPVWPVPTTAVPAGATGPRAGSDRARPRQVRVACLLTWGFGALSGLASLLLLLMVAVARQDLVDRVVADPRWDSSLDRDMIVPAMTTFGVVVLAWCVLNAVLAWFVWRGRRGAWVGLSVSIGLAAGFAVAGFPFSLVHLAALAVSLGMLLSVPARSWFAGR